MSEVFLLKLKDFTIGEVQELVKRGMESVEWYKEVVGNSIFVKVNLLSKQVVPGQCTSPWVFEGVLQGIRNRFPKMEIFYGDSDVSATRQLNDAVGSWGLKKIGDMYKATFVNLSKQDTAKIKIGRFAGVLDIPELLLKMDNLITVPVIKTHCIVPMTASLKNLWGFLPRVRYKLHPVVNDVIPEINVFFSKFILAVGDMTIAMEGPGPRVGKPKICNIILVSKDRVALDHCAASIMGMDADSIEYIKNSEKAGVGSTRYIIRGDKFENLQFKIGIADEHIVFRWRDRLEKIPIINILIYLKPVFRILGFFATLYHEKIWYLKKGKKYAKEVCQHPLYHKEFKC